jgi:hypothetical protein
MLRVVMLSVIMLSALVPLGSLQLHRPLIVLIHFPDFVDETMPNNPLYLTKTLAVSVWQSKITASWTNITSEPGMNTLKL